MIKINVSEAAGIQLDWLVAKCEGITEHDMGRWKLPILEACTAYQYSPSAHWSQGGPIIEREEISVEQSGKYGWIASRKGPCSIGPTPLIAAMRCCVASKLGDEVEVPEELS